jgi:hypothetical protein
VALFDTLQEQLPAVSEHGLLGLACSGKEQSSAMSEHGQLGLARSGKEQSSAMSEHGMLGLACSGEERECVQASEVGVCLRRAQEGEPS